MSISFKVTFGSDVRRFTLPLLLEESALLRQVMVLLGKLYDLNEEQVKNLELKYVDNEGDLITIGGPSDLKEGYNHMADSLMRLHAKVGDRQRIQFTDTMIITGAMESPILFPKQEPIIPQSFMSTPSIPINILKKKEEPILISPTISPFTPINLSNSPILSSSPNNFSESPNLSTSPSLSNSSVQKLDFSKLQSNDTVSHGVNSSRGSQTVTSARGGTVIIKGGSSVSTTHTGNVSVTHAGGSVAINSHGSAVVTRQGSGVITSKGSSLVVQKK